MDYFGCLHDFTFSNLTYLNFTLILPNAALVFYIEKVRYSCSEKEKQKEKEKKKKGKEEENRI